MTTDQSVAVVVVTYDGRDYLEPCLASLEALEAPGAAEVIVVDNASRDGTAAMVRERFPSVQLVANPRNVGFSPAVNQGARLASSRYVALLNNDATADPAWLAAAVEHLEAHPNVACIASRILRTDGHTVDYAGGQLSFYGHGFARNNDEPTTAADEVTRPTLFASGGAMVARRDLFLEVGGFDETYFAFFEDVDFGWRLWLLGHEVAYVGTSVVYHRHHGTIERFGYPRERYLLERNALATITKNYGDDLLRRTLAGSLGLSLLRGLADSETSLPDYAIPSEPRPLGEPAVSPLTGAHLAAIRDWALMLPDLDTKRRVIQAARVVDDRRLAPLFETPLLPNEPDGDFLAAFAAVVRAGDLRDAFERPGYILILTADQVGAQMAGPAIRCWEMANLLSKEHEVVLASTRRPEAAADPFAVVHVDARGRGEPTHAEIAAVPIETLLDGAEVVILQGFIMFFLPQIAAAKVPVVCDLYDPFHLEGLELQRNAPSTDRWSMARSDVAIINDQLTRGDFFVCASDKQRDLWLGQLSGLGRVNPGTYDQDSSLRQLLDVAPFGLPAEPPVAQRSGIRGVVDGIGADDFVLLWGGGIYEWFDPLTLIRAVGRAAEVEPRIKLFFMGTRHPNPDVPLMPMAARAEDLAAALGLAGRNVFFHEGWVPYERRADYLLDADVGVSTHYEHLETAFSFRTRMLDYFWAGLPVLATSGDGLSQLVADRRLGIAVPPEDVEALTAAILRLASDIEFREGCREAVAVAAAEMTWEHALEPIVRFCREPRRAADHAAVVPRALGVPATGSLARRVLGFARVAGPGGVTLAARKFATVLRRDGLRAAVRKVRTFLDLRARG